MKSSELFGVAVRTVGLVNLLFALASAQLLFSSGFSSTGFVVRELVWLALSVYLLRGAPAVVRFAYPTAE